MLVALATQYAYSLGEGCANGDAARFLSAVGLTQLQGHQRSHTQQAITCCCRLQNLSLSVASAGRFRLRRCGFDHQTLFKQPLKLPIQA
jgi:hypothetical protein